MIKKLKPGLLQLIILGFLTNGFAQETDIEGVRAELMQMNQQEQEAFNSGDCQKVINLMDDNITFFANGRKAPSKMMIQKFCEGIPRPFGKLGKDEVKFYPLSSTSGYVVRTMDIIENEQVVRKEIVTKIWKKGTNGWKIVHLHTTVKDVSE